jgi:hypothetical protein
VLIVSYAKLPTTKISDIVVTPFKAAPGPRDQRVEFSSSIEMKLDTEGLAVQGSIVHSPVA